ncbi:MAG: sigma-70 family RNA polymerase sigma factor [Byssovorax sp.]
MHVDFLGNPSSCRQKLRVKPPSAPPVRPARRLAGHELLAQRTLFRVIHAFVWQALRRLRVPVRDRADLVQDVMLALFRRHDTYDPDRGVPAAWVQGFVVNVARAYLRRERPEEMLVIDDEDEEDETLIAPSPAEEGVELDELRRILHDELLPRVPFEQRVIVLARDVDGLEMRDVAEQLEIPLSTAYDRYQRGRAALERAHARWEARRRDRGLLLFPIGLGQILERDWPVPPVPAGVERAAWARLRATMLTQAALALIRRPITRLGLTFAAGAAFGAATVAAARPPPVVTTSVVPLPYPVAVTAEAETRAHPIGPAFTLEPAPPEPVDRAKRRPLPTSEPAPREQPLVVEQRLFEAARQAFDRDDLGAALDALSAHERAFPAGDFASEREILWIKTLMRAGRSDEARARLDRLRRSETGKALAERIEGYVPSLRSGD